MAALNRALDRAKAVNLDVDLEGEIFHVRMDASRFSTSEVLALATSPDPAERIERIVAMIQGWDLTYRDPEPGEDPADLLVPVSKEWFADGEGSALVLGAIVKAMQEMAAPGEANGSSGAG